MIATIDSHPGIVPTDVVAFPGWAVLWLSSFVPGAGNAFGVLFAVALAFDWAVWTVLLLALHSAWNALCDRRAGFSAP